MSFVEVNIFPVEEKDREEVACGNAEPKGGDLGWTSISIPGKTVYFPGSRTGMGICKGTEMRAGS